MRIECSYPPEDFGWVLSCACPFCPRRARERQSFVLRASSASGEMEFAPEGWSVPLSYYTSHQELADDVRVQWLHA
jgi:hypothetical protein